MAATGTRCGDAATGLEHSTRGIRSPDSSVLWSMEARCREDRWPRAAIACFARMSEDDLGRCAMLLPDEARGLMLGVLGAGGDRAAIAVARLRLRALQIGVGECDRFVAEVDNLMSCEQVPIDTRVMLGNQTAELWDLPTEKLSTEIQQRMADACGASLAELEQQAAGVGCM